MTKKGARLLCRDTAGGHAHDTTMGSLRHGAGAPATRRWGACDTALGRLRHGAGAPATRRWGACDTATRARSWVRLCAPRCGGWVSRLCTWCTLSAFGLSIVYESLFGHCS